MPSFTIRSKSGMGSSFSLTTAGRDAAEEHVEDATERVTKLRSRRIELHLQESVDTRQEDVRQLERGQVAPHLATLLGRGESLHQGFDERARFAAHLVRVPRDDREEL